MLTHLPALRYPDPDRLLLPRDWPLPVPLNDFSGHPECKAGLRAAGRGSQQQPKERRGGTRSLSLRSDPKARLDALDGRTAREQVLARVGGNRSRQP